MHLESAMISTSTIGNNYYQHHFLGADSALSPEHMASCSPSLISPYPAGLSSTMVNSPVSPPVMSPPANSYTTNDIMDTKVFQFPPPTHLQQHTTIMGNILPPTPHPLPDPTLNSIKQEEWNVPCLQDNLTSHGNINLDHDGGIVPSSSSVHQVSNDGLQHLCFPAVASTSNTLQNPDQGSPMAISPNTLNTPRGSITSFRSRSQQNSPMNMDSVLTTFTSLAPTSVSSSCATSCTAATSNTLSSTQMEMLNDISASFTIQVQQPSSNISNQTCSASTVTSMQDQTMLSSFHNNDAAPFHTHHEGENTQYISYTMLQPSLTMPATSTISDNSHLDQHQLQQKYPSPPRSPVQSMPQYSHSYQQNVAPHNNPPPTYEEFMNGGMVMPMGNEDHLGQNLASTTNPADVLSSTEVHNFFNDGSLKTEPDLDIPFIQSTMNGQDPIKCKSGIIGSLQDHDSLFTSDTCPETPDSSVKEDTDVNSPDTGNYTCLWLDCNEEFDNPKTYVDHVNEAHMETRKGCEEFPCLWKVTI